MSIPINRVQSLGEQKGRPKDGRETLASMLVAIVVDDATLLVTVATYVVMAAVRMMKTSTAVSARVVANVGPL